MFQFLHQKVNFALKVLSFIIRIALCSMLGWVKVDEQEQVLRVHASLFFAAGCEEMAGLEVWFWGVFTCTWWKWRLLVWCYGFCYGEVNLFYADGR